MYSTSSHTFSSLSTTGPANVTFSQSRSVDQVTVPEDDGPSQASSLDANQSGESVGNSSFGEDSSTAPVTIGQQKATAILPEVHLVTGEYYQHRHVTSGYTRMIHEG